MANFFAVGFLCLLAIGLLLSYNLEKQKIELLKSCPDVNKHLILK